ncbi:MAG: hypothetical protein QW767_03735 [Thermoprotei archaeon]
MFAQQPTRLSRRIAAVAILAPLALVLTQGPRIPFPLLPFLTMELWEIPVYFSLMVLDAKTALTVEGIVYIAVQILVPGVLPFGPVYNLVAVISTIGGAVVGFKALAGRIRIPVAIALGTAVRTAVMILFNSIFLPLKYPFGFNVPLSKLDPGVSGPVVLGFIGLFNAVVAAYSLVFAAILAKAVSRRLRAGQ